MRRGPPSARPRSRHVIMIRGATQRPGGAARVDVQRLDRTGSLSSDENGVAQLVRVGMPNAEESGVAAAERGLRWPFAEIFFPLVDKPTPTPTPPPPTDPVLQRAVHLHRSLLALKRL